MTEHFYNDPFTGLVHEIDQLDDQTIVIHTKGDAQAVLDANKRDENHGDPWSPSRDLKHVDMVLCTLKDAVKLGARWPRLGPPLWYVSQDVQVERGVGGLDSVLDGVVRTRTPRTPSQIAG